MRDFCLNKYNPYTVRVFKIGPNTVYFASIEIMANELTLTVPTFSVLF